MRSPEPAIGLSTMTPAMADAKNYYRWIADAVAPSVGNCVLDVGGGMGTLLHFFLDRPRLFTLDISEGAVAHLQKTFRIHSHVQVLHGDVTDPEIRGRLQAEKIDTILCTNVLEHVEDDPEMLRSLAMILEPTRGRLALLVPAHGWLYGSLDDKAGHYRRYTRSQVLSRLAEAGFQPQVVRYMNFAAVPGWWFAGRVRRQGLADPASNAQVRFYDRFVVPIARRVEAVIPPPVGLSVLAIALVGSDREGM